ncbi:hypothetical protein NDU88_008059 [Pleurodeles waltl]|uniref:Reverse transcriptase domain-containing protein n=1 Tax=Pleurodeles waltl TaxID=8319 RepID=A0AAV7RVT4_PLEWA|nr:hypothetical protein NDU88_008059 [Pleurodeles waltl]
MLARGGYDRVYHAGFSRGSRGAAILLHRSLPMLVTATQSDPQGRFIVVKGTLHGSPINLVCVYGPPAGLDAFLLSLCRVAAGLPQGTTLLGGDFNAVLNPSLDVSGEISTNRSARAASFSSWAESFGMCEVWRTWHPRERRYTHTSAAHSTQSRIDLIFMPALDINNVTGAELLPRGVSDHPPVRIWLGGTDPTRRLIWRLNAWNLQDNDYTQEIKNHLTQYFELNLGSVQSPGTLWAACKATLRGQAKYLLRSRERARDSQLSKLETKALILERQQMTSESASVLRQLTRVREEIKHTALESEKHIWRASAARIYGWGDKNGKLLHWLATRPLANRVIPEIMEDSGSLSKTPIEIAQRFASYYTRLYAEHPRPTAEKESPLLNGITLPSVPLAIRDRIDEPIDLAEVISAITSLAPGKTPGPDGFPAELYKRCSDILGPHLLSMYEEAEKQGRFPNEIDQATIVVIPKTQPPSRHCSAYRPISLLNTEIKVLSSILASRLREVIPTLVHPDHCGFMPTRSTRHCIRRLHLALAHHTTLSHTPLALLLLDFEKAFDTVDWSFLDHVLLKNGLGPKFRRLVKLLYSNPTARVQVNGVVSDAFPIGRGTRQGCPLSPLLFALIIEPLAILLRNDPLIEGWPWPNCPEDRVALYADDVLLYISNPARSGPRVLQLLSLFAEASGLILNPNKSLLVPLPRSRDCVDWQQSIPVRRNSFKYLGIYISLLPELTWELNVTPLTRRIKTDLQRWRALPLNLLGRIALYKMMILPRLLYLLQNFPHPIPKKWFGEMDSLARQFMWNDARPRLALKTCQRDIYNGGWACPTSIIISTRCMWS